MHLSYVLFILEEIVSLLSISDLLNGIKRPAYQNDFDDLTPMEFARKCNLVLVCSTSVRILAAVNWLSL